MLRAEWTNRGLRLLQLLFREVHLVGVLWEILNIFGLDGLIQVLELAHLSTSQQLHLKLPNNRDAHALSRVGYDSTGQQVRLDFHKCLLVQAEISEELGVLFEILSRLFSGIVNSVLWLLHGAGLEKPFILEEAAL